MSKKETLQDALITGLLRRNSPGYCDMTDESVNELTQIWEKKESTDMMQMYWNALSHKDSISGEMLGWVAVNEIFEEFVREYPNIAKTLTICIYS